ncbi:tRNA pseudouridine(38-40) synthase [Gammaproteobacteria bacterium]
MRFALGLEYDGSAFHGWQSQTGMRTVQSCLEQALSKVANQPITVVVAGRTDAGVHAGAGGTHGQVAHFDTAVRRSSRAWVLGGNLYLPPDVAICWVRIVSDDFHARFSARSRHYRYVIHNSLTRAALNRTRVTWEHRRLDVEKMANAASYLLGTHDFSSFRARGCQAKSPIRTIQCLNVARDGTTIIIEVVANAFLHHMVRNIVGVLITIGAGERPTEWTREVLEKRNRSCGGVTAPPEGLHLIGVEYPSRFGIPPLTAWEDDSP